MSLSRILRHSPTRTFIDQHLAFPKPATFPLVVQPTAQEPQTLGLAFEVALAAGLAARGAETIGKAHAAHKALDRMADLPLAWRPPALDRWGVAKVREAEQRLTTLVPDQALPYERSADCWLLAELTAYTRAEDEFVADLDRVRALGSGPPSKVSRELEDLYAAVNWTELTPTQPVLLSPTFGEGSNMVGGAIGDLVIDDLLIDVKVVKTPSVSRAWWRQAALYAILANHFGIDGAPDRRIEHVGLYLARSGRLVRVPLSELVTPEEAECIVDRLADGVPDTPLTRLRERGEGLLKRQAPPWIADAAAHLPIRGREAIPVKVSTDVEAYVLPFVATAHGFEARQRDEGTWEVEGPRAQHHLFAEAWASHRNALKELNRALGRAWVEAAYPDARPEFVIEVDRFWQLAYLRRLPRSKRRTEWARMIADIRPIRRLVQDLQDQLHEALIPLAEKGIWDAKSRSGNSSWKLGRRA